MDEFKVCNKCKDELTRYKKLSDSQTEVPVLHFGGQINREKNAAASILLVGESLERPKLPLLTSCKLIL